jgi:hypothetical protein
VQPGAGLAAARYVAGAVRDYLAPDAEGGEVGPEIIQEGGRF